MDKNTTWINVIDEPPTYYSLKLVKTKNGSAAIAWRASDGDNEMYTIAGTDVIIENVVKWRDIPE